MTHLYLIRHGEADGFKPGQAWYTFPNPGLSRLGIKQAERLRDRLAATGEIRADALISSTLMRARETAEIIAPALGLPIIFDDEVQEFNMGEAEGLPIEEIKERFGLSDLWEEPFRRIAPNGESWAEFVTRACRGLDRLTREYADKTVVIVCHGGVIEASFIAFLGLNMLRQAIFVASQNTSITHWQKGTFEGQEGKWCLRRVNDHAHLLDLDASQRIPWEALAVKREQAPVSAPVAPEQ